MSPYLEETITVDFITSSPTTGAVIDADSTPTCEIFEDAIDTAILSPTVVKRTGKTGDYRVPIVCTTANGFESGKSYNVIASATVGGVAAKAAIKSFQVRTYDLYSSGNGGTLRFDDIWKWTTAGSVSSGQIRGNVTDWNTITELWIHNVTNGNTNLSAYLRAVKADDTIRVQQENNPAVWNSYLIGGAAVDMTTWVKIPVTLRAGAGVNAPSTATNCLVSFFRPNNLDWTDTERSQIRHRLGIDGTTIAPSTGDPSLASEADLTAMASSTATSFSTVNTKLDTIDDFVDTEIGAIKAKTDQLVFTSGKVDANATVTLTPTDLNAMADALLKRDWNSVTGEAAYSALNAFRMLRNAWNTTGGTLSVKKEDGTTNAWTRSLATDPAAQPITGAS